MSDDKYYTAPQTRKRVEAPDDKAFAAQKAGELELLKLKKDLSFQKLQQGQRMQTLNDGTVVRALSVMGQDKIEVLVPDIAPEEKPGEEIELEEPPCYCGAVLAECEIVGLCYQKRAGFGLGIVKTFGVGSVFVNEYDLPGELYAVRLCLPDDTAEEEDATKFSDFQLYSVPPSDFTRYYPGDRVLMAYLQDDVEVCATNQLFEQMYSGRIAAGYTKQEAEGYMTLFVPSWTPVILPMQLAELSEEKQKDNCLKIPQEDLEAGLVARFTDAVEGVCPPIPKSTGMTYSVFSGVMGPSSYLGDVWQRKTSEAPIEFVHEVFFSNLPSNSGRIGGSWLSRGSGYMTFSGIRLSILDVASGLAPSIGSQIPEAAGGDGTDTPNNRTSAVCFLADRGDTIDDILAESTVTLPVPTDLSERYMMWARAYPWLYATPVDGDGEVIGIIDITDSVQRFFLPSTAYLTGSQYGFSVISGDVGTNPFSGMLPSNGLGKDILEDAFCSDTGVSFLSSGTVSYSSGSPTVIDSQTLGYCATGDGGVYSWVGNTYAFTLTETESQTTWPACSGTVSPVYFVSGESLEEQTKGEGCSGDSPTYSLVTEYGGFYTQSRQWVDRLGADGGSANYVAISVPQEKTLKQVIINTGTYGTSAETIYHSPASTCALTATMTITSTYDGPWDFIYCGGPYFSALKNVIHDPT